MLGTAQRISALTDGSPLAAAAQDIFTDCRDEVLAEHPWNPALRRAVVALTANTVTKGEWLYAYELPADCLRWLPWAAGHSLAFAGIREGRYLLTDEAKAPTIRYIATLDDLAQWTPGMREALSAKLAIWLATAAPVQSEVSSSKAAKIYDAALSAARRQDGLETGDRESDARVRSSWLNARDISSGLV